MLVGQIGEMLVTARRKGSTWYLGGMSAEQARDLALPLAFLDAGQYPATVWKDAPDAGILSQPPHHRNGQSVTSGDTLKLHIARGRRFCGTGDACQEVGS